MTSQKEETTNLLQKIYDNATAIQDVSGAVIGWQLDTVMYAEIEEALYSQESEK